MISYILTYIMIPIIVGAAVSLVNMAIWEKRR